MLLGVPEQDRHALFEAVEHIFDFRGDRESFETTDEGAAAQVHMAEYGTALIAEKRAHPTDDMLSVVVHATLDDVDPPGLSDSELFLFFSLLFSAGSETTRNVPPKCATRSRMLSSPRPADGDGVRKYACASKPRPSSSISSRTASASRVMRTST